MGQLQRISFAVGASSGLYMFAYTVWFLVTKMKMGVLSNDACFLIYVYLFIGCYMCAMGYIAV